MPGRKETRNNRIQQLKEHEVSPKNKSNRWSPPNDSFMKAELVLLRSYMLFHLVYNLGSLVVTHLDDLGHKANLW